MGVIGTFLMTALFYRFYEKKHLIFLGVFAFSLVALFVSPTADTLKIMGMGAGGIAGFLLENKYVQFTTECSGKKKVIRLIAGVVTLLLIRIVLKKVLPSTEEGALFYTKNNDLYIWGGFFRYMVMGLYGTFIYPLIFKKLNF